MTGVADRRALNAEGLLGIFYVLDYGVTGDGQHADAGGFQAAINAATLAGGGLIAVPPGVYRLERNVVWGAAVNVTIWQHSGVTFTGPGTLPASAGSNNIRVEPSGAAIGGAPTTQAFGDVAAAGASGVAADSAHRHGMPGNGSVGTTQLAAGAVGTTQLAAGAATGAALGADVITTTDVNRGAWTPFTPTLTQGVSVTATVNTAHYLKIGRLAVVYIQMTASSTGTAGGGIVIGGIPAAIAPLVANTVSPAGTALVSSSPPRVGAVVFSSASQLAVQIDNNTGFLGAAPAVTLASGTVIALTAVWETAN